MHHVGLDDATVGKQRALSCHWELSYRRLSTNPENFRRLLPMRRTG